MKSYATQAIAKQMATKQSNKTGIHHVFVAMQDSDLWVVMTETELAAQLQAQKASQEELAAANVEAEFQRTDAAVEKNRKLRPVIAEFAFKGENEKYFFVEVDSRKFGLAKSRVTGVVVGDFITVSMTAKYAGHRPELKLAA